MRCPLGYRPLSILVDLEGGDQVLVNLLPAALGLAGLVVQSALLVDLVADQYEQIDELSLSAAGVRLCDGMRHGESEAVATGVGNVSLSDGFLDRQESSLAPGQLPGISNEEPFQDGDFLPHEVPFVDAVLSVRLVVPVALCQMVIEVVHSGRVKGTALDRTHPTTWSWLLCGGLLCSRLVDDGLLHHWLHHWLLDDGLLDGRLREECQGWELGSSNPKATHVLIDRCRQGTEEMGLVVIFDLVVVVGPDQLCHGVSHLTSHHTHVAHTHLVQVSRHPLTGWVVSQQTLEAARSLVHGQQGIHCRVWVVSKDGVGGWWIGLG